MKEGLAKKNAFAANAYRNTTEYIVLPGFVNPVSNVRMTLLDDEQGLARKASGYLPDEFVASIGNEIYDLTWTLDIEQVASTLDEEKVE